MTKKEYLDRLSNMKVDDSKINKINKIYQAELTEIIKKIISNNKEPVFFDDDWRVLSFDEIIDAQHDLHIDFKERGIIPLIDCGENDFIVYHFRDKIWSKFNIVDEIVFKKKKSLEELLK